MVIPDFVIEGTSGHGSLTYRGNGQGDSSGGVRDVQARTGIHG
jgi:hypothetical protein